MPPDLAGPKDRLPDIGMLFLSWPGPL